MSQRLCRVEARLLIYIRGRKAVTVRTALREASLLFCDVGAEQISAALLSLADLGAVEIYPKGDDLVLCAIANNAEQREPGPLERAATAPVPRTLLVSHIAAVVLLGCASVSSTEVRRDPEIQVDARPSHQSVVDQGIGRRQVRLADGSVNFLTCVGEECAGPTPKTVATGPAIAAAEVPPKLVAVPHEVDPVLGDTVAAADVPTWLSAAVEAQPVPVVRTVELQATGPRGPDASPVIAGAPALSPPLQSLMRSITLRHRVELVSGTPTAEGARSLARAKALSRKATAIMIRSYAVGQEPRVTRQSVASANASGLLATFRQTASKAVVRANWCTDCAGPRPAKGAPAQTTYADVLVVVQVPLAVAQALDDPKASAALRQALGCAS